ncbi:MAG: DUF882 domain-containing protein [Rhizobiaceae bacterium]
MTKRVTNASEWRTGLSAWRRIVACGLLAIFATLALATAASAETRTLKLFFVHTREKAEITYKKNGRYLKGGLNQINRFLRDWRRNEPTKMDPRLLDLIWEVYKKSGSRKHIHVISAYRSPATNAMLRKRGRGVAKKSQHTLGKAMDFYIPDVKLSKLRRIGLQMQNGGVGYYPRSGSPFVHMDVGSVRHWPRMSRRELVAVFPNGKTLHVPKDGKPLPGYKQALASYNKRRKSGGGVVIASAESRTPGRNERNERNDRDRRGGNFLTAFFSGGQDNEEDRVQAATEPKRVKTIPAPAPLEQQPKTPEMIIAALPARDVPLPLFAPRPKVEVGNPADVAEEVPVEAEAETVEVALAIPRPTPRPQVPTEDRFNARLAVAEDADISTGTVIASAGKSGIDDALAIMRGIQPDTGKSDRVIAVPLPEKGPRLEPKNPIVLAALPNERSVLDAEPTRYAVPTPREKDVVETKEEPPQVVISGEAAAASPREFILASIEPIDPLEALKTGVRTTGKSNKPDAGDKKAKRQVMIVPLPANLSRHTLSKTHIARARGRSKAPSFIFDLVGTSPSEVYTSGFSRTARIANPYRFTGKAVEFLSVAKFN